MSLLSADSRPFAQQRRQRHNIEAHVTATAIPEKYGGQTIATDTEMNRIRRLRRSLLSWFDQNKRDLPWRGVSDPYRIWLSEIMLQQTQVERVIPYYERFVEHFPRVEDLAEADLDEVLALWAGLGYYSRARNLHAAAQMIAGEFNRRFPRAPEQVRSLPGVGEYTRGAVCSIAFGEPLPALDANARRVLARVFGIRGNIRKGDPKLEVEVIGETAVDPHHPGEYNQALMELGAVVCTARTPSCGDCPLSDICRAAELDIAEQIPPPRPTKTVHRRFVAGVVAREDRYLIRQRPPEGLWGGLWEFPNFEHADAPPEEILVRRLSEEYGIAGTDLQELTQFTYGIMNQQVQLTVIALRCDEPPEGEKLTWATADELAEFPFPSPHSRIAELIRQETETAD